MVKAKVNAELSLRCPPVLCLPPRPAALLMKAPHPLRPSDLPTPPRSQLMWSSILSFVAFRSRRASGFSRASASAGTSLSTAPLT